MGGDSPPPTPDFAGHRGSLQGKNVEFGRGTTDSVSVNLSAARKFFRGNYVRSCGCKGVWFFFLVVTKKKGNPRRAFYKTAGQCTVSPPEPKGGSFAPGSITIIIYQMPQINQTCPHL